MKINIRERYQKIWECVQEQSNRSIRAIAELTGMSKSSVHRHLTARKRRQKYPESQLWETTEGDAWLRLLVFGVVYCFGIKGGIGADSLSAFFHLLHLEERIGCSASALREIETQMRVKIIAYEQAQTEACQSKQPIGICVGADETFFGLPILVAVELASGFIFSEVECENRTYDTWWKQIGSWFNPAQWDCRFLVSDGAKALIKLALSGLNCPSVPDLFHLLYGLSKSMGTAIARAQAALNTQLVNHSSSMTDEQLVILQARQQQLTLDCQDYHQSLHSLSQAIHPFHIGTGESQLGIDLPAHLQPHLATLERLSTTYAPTKSPAALECWHRALPGLSGILHAWWQWVLQSLSAQTPDLETQNWVLNCLLPWVYWHQQTNKTRSPLLKQSYAQAAQLAHQRLLAFEFTSALSSSQQQQWIDWAIWIVAKFQRTSSAVEGRNGYLSGLHHSHRGFTEQTLKVLTIIHNFDIKRDDGSTAAQRLFHQPFPDLFDWIVSHMGDLPRSRRTLKTPKSQKPTLQAVPL